MTETFKVVSPADGSIYAERVYSTRDEAVAVLQLASDAHSQWRNVPVAERAEYCRRFVAAMLRKTDDCANEISWQMGRPISQTPKEIQRLAQRAEYMIYVAASALSNIVPELEHGYTRFIR